MSFYVSWFKILPYSKKSVIDNIEDIGGIYKLLYKNANGMLIVFYVGQADELRTKLLLHLNKSENNLCVKTMLNTERCYFHVAYLKNQGDRNCAERFLYEHYLPDCNHVVPSGEPCPINLD